jgi:sterol desaturase/sphingolipid hydroxylase (fatty acid hydroxylase superfamily)
MAIYEMWSPRLEREEMKGAWKSKRWFTNLSIVVISSVALRIIFPAAAVGTAFYAQSKGWGLFPALGISPVVAGILSFPFSISRSGSNMSSATRCRCSGGSTACTTPTTAST